MELIPLDEERLIRRSALWLTERRNRQWLDFGDGAHDMGPGTLKAMARDDAHIIRAFTADDTGDYFGFAPNHARDHETGLRRPFPRSRMPEPLARYPLRRQIHL